MRGYITKLLYLNGLSKFRMPRTVVSANIQANGTVIRIKCNLYTMDFPFNR